MRMLVLTFLFFVPMAGALPAGSGIAVAEAQAAETSRVTLRIDGMTCGSCAAAVKVKLERLDGVREARVSFDEKRARVTYDARQVTPQRMIEAIEDLGYRARVDDERRDG